MAITKAEAAPIARQLRYIGDDNPAALRDFVGKLQGTYGEYADEVLSATLQHANINRDLAVATTEALTKIARGTVPGPADRRRMDRAGNGQRMDDALGGRVGSVPNPFTGEGAPAAQPTGRPPVDVNEIGQDYQNAGGTMPPTAAAKAAPEPGTFRGSPSGQDIGALVQHRADPTVLAEFDAVYGPGTAQRVLSEADRRMPKTGAR